MLLRMLWRMATHHKPLTTNHSLLTTHQVQPATAAPRDLGAGEEVLITYRHEGNAPLLLDYGFAETRRPGQLDSELVWLTNDMAIGSDVCDRQTLAVLTQRVRLHPSRTAPRPPSTQHLTCSPPLAHPYPMSTVLTFALTLSPITLTLTLTLALALTLTLALALALTLILALTLTLTLTSASRGR